MGKYSTGLQQAIEDRQKAVEAAVVDFVNANSAKLPFEFVDIKMQGKITAAEIYKEICTDGDFKGEYFAGDQREPAVYRVKYVKADR